MQVVGVEQFGGPEALAVHEVPEPHAGSGSVRIRVHAFAVNPTDTGVRAGQRDSWEASPPFVPGMDAAGVIDEVGPDVSGWAVGDEVMAMALPLSAHGGAYVQELVAPVGSFTRVPRGTSLALASTVPMNGLTALQILSRAALAPGQTLAVTGAAGLLGNYVVQLAKAAGITVIADAGPADESLVRSLGPSHVVPRGSSFASAVRALVPDGVDALADASVQRFAVVDAVRDGGAFFSVRGWEGNGDRDIWFDKIMVFEEYRSFDKLEQLRHAVESGTLTPRVAEVLPAARAGEAHERLEAGGVRGRFVLTWEQRSRSRPGDGLEARCRMVSRLQSFDVKQPAQLAAPERGTARPAVSRRVKHSTESRLYSMHRIR